MSEEYEFYLQPEDERRLRRLAAWARVMAVLFLLLFIGTVISIIPYIIQIVLYPTGIEQFVYPGLRKAALILEALYRPFFIGVAWLLLRLVTLGVPRLLALRERVLNS